MKQLSLVSTGMHLVSNMGSVPKHLHHDDKHSRHARDLSEHVEWLGFSIDNMDPAADPRQDFYRFAAGGWMDLGINYGSLGAVIGHELTHGFDSMGRRFDAQGNMVDWWTANDTEEFSELTGMLVEQFNQYEVLPDLFVNGELTAMRPALSG